MHLKSFYTQQHCYVSLKTLYPGGIQTRVFSFLRRMRCPLRHAARAKTIITLVVKKKCRYKYIHKRCFVVITNAVFFYINCSVLFNNLPTGYRYLGKVDHSIRAAIRKGMAWPSKLNHRCQYFQRLPWAVPERFPVMSLEV
jgi:hypothetical protein